MEMPICHPTRVVRLCATVLLAGLAAAAQAEDVVIGAKPGGWVERALFTSGISNREPVDAVVVMEEPRQEIYFFTELKQLAGRTVTHRWEYAGQVIAETPFEVGGPRWRVYSKQVVSPSQPGKWTVVVVDESGWVLHAEMFEYRPAR